MSFHFSDDIRVVLLDFDGLLVNTEELHFAAYQRMCAFFGVHMPLSFRQFCDIAHASAVGLQKTLQETIPSLFRQQPRWDVLYAEKKRQYLELLDEGNVSLMPFVGRFLSFLEGKKIKRAVVTNSPKEQIEAIKRHIPLLNSIPLWITREQYKHPKPAADGYLRALAELVEPQDRVIGFEDTLRGFLALEEAEVQGVVVSSVLSLEHQRELVQRGAVLLTSFEELTWDP